MSRTQKELERLRQEIAGLEAELSVTGSTKTADDVQAELDNLANDMQVLSACSLTARAHVTSADARTSARSKL